MRLRLLVELGRRGSISAAADACGMGQPSGTKHLQTLEAAVGEKLVERHGRSSRLTEAGEIVATHGLRVLDTLRVDIAFIGTNAISVRHGLSTPDSDEATVKRAMVRAANYVVVAADSSKIGREDFVSFAPISSVDTLITDSEISPADREQLTASGVEVVVA